MKLYSANGTYCGTQADAKAISKEFEAVDVPVDKAGLIDYLNGLVKNLPDLGDGRYLPSAVPSTESATTGAVEPPEPVIAPGTFILATGSQLDEAFALAPIGQRLRLAVTAIDTADAMIENVAAYGRARSVTAGTGVIDVADHIDAQYADDDDDLEDLLR